MNNFGTEITCSLIIAAEVLEVDELQSHFSAKQCQIIKKGEVLSSTIPPAPCDCFSFDFKGLTCGHILLLPESPKRLRKLKKVPTPGVMPTSKPLSMAKSGYIISWAAHSVKEVNLKSMDNK